MTKLVDRIELYRLRNPVYGKEFSWRLLGNDGQEIARSKIGYSQGEVCSKTKEILEEACNADFVYADPKGEIKIAEIGMWDFIREMLLNQHDSFIKQVNFRVFDNFNEAAITKDAEKATKEFYERRSLTSSTEGGDDADIRQDAYEHGGDLYIMLTDMKDQVIFAILASLYHQWEKDLQTYMKYELKRRFHRIECMLEALKSSGWNFQETSWFQTIEDCRWIVNLYKHGRKKAPKGLVKRQPQFFKKEVIELLGECDDRIWEYRDLSITREGFFQAANAFKQFWVDFPSYPNQRDDDIPIRPI